MREYYYSNDGTISAYCEGKTENGKQLFYVSYKKNSGYCVSQYEAHNIKLYSWARRLHGNAPSGTPYGYFRASQNGKRVIITV